jgi:2-dehydropantoate 2-reductase
MKIAVFGSGGVGGYFGGRLAQAGVEVVFIARGEHLRALQEKGLHVESSLGSFHLPKVTAVEQPARAGQVDGVLVALKAWQIAEAAPELPPILKPESWVLPLSNGVEASAQLAEALGGEHVLGGLSRISSFISGPGRIHHAAIEPFIAFGELDGRFTPRLQALQQVFERAGIAAEVRADIQRAVWEKFVFIAPLSGVGAVARRPVGDFRHVPHTRRLLQAAVEETAAVGRAQGIDLAPYIVSRTLAIIDGLAPHTVASMQRDIQEGRPSELEAQTGAVVRFGQQAGVDTPVSSFLYAALLPAELHARGRPQTPA